MVELTAQQHKELGISLFNQTWDYLDKPVRTEAENFTMMDLAHASAYHWSFAGTHVNVIRSEWQLARVYAVLSMGETALLHAKRCVALCEEHAVTGFDYAFALEAAARAYSVLNNAALKEDYKQKALAAAAEVQDEKDRAYAEKDINSIQ